MSIALTNLSTLTIFEDMPVQLKLYYKRRFLEGMRKDVDKVVHSCLSAKNITYKNNHTAWYT